MVVLFAAPMAGFVTTHCTGNNSVQCIYIKNDFTCFQFWFILIHMEPVTTLKKILIIEDEYFIQELYVRALAKAGYEVTVRLDGQTGLAAAQTDTYDIILLDLMIPTITGIEVLRTLNNRKLTPRLHARIIVTTNLEQRDDIRRDIEHQADGYLIKVDMTPRQLVEFLSKLQ